MSGGAPSDEDKPAPGSAETAWLGEKPGPNEPAAALHEEATILGGLDVSRPGESSPDERPAGVVDLPEFRQALIDIGLFDETELDILAAGVPESQGVLGLARLLQQAGRLTAYQAAALYQRKSRGLLIGNYLILDKLGVGGMGMVFKARHRKLGRVVALKILPPSFARDKTAVLRFKREVEAAGRLKHPNVVSALDADEDRGVHFLVMEYVDGSDLDRVVRQRGQLTLSQAIDFAIQAARGLEAAHAQGIVHRDIKPSNLMLDAAGTVRVLDLGLARIVETSNPFGQAAGTRLTESGMYMGTVDYMAPEQAEDSRQADHRADIYSLGCTLYFLLTGREPFVGETVLKRLMAHLERPAPTLKALRPDAPTPLEEIYQKMMVKRPADRPQSMTEVIRLLEACQTAAAEAPAPKGGISKAPRNLIVFDEGDRKTDKGPAPARAARDASVFARRDDAEGLEVGPELSLEDLVKDVRPEVPLVPVPVPTIKRVVKPREPVAARSLTPKRKHRQWVQPLNLALQGTALAVVCGFIAFMLWPRRPPRPQPIPAGEPPVSTSPTRVPTTWAAARTIFDGTSGKGWMLTSKKPLPRANVQPEGLNPRGTGSYLVVYEKKLGDFILDFDYKLSEGCNSGVFLRVGDLNDPVNTGIEVALDDTTGSTERDSGAFYGLVAPARNAQLPAGEWNHMIITAQGPVIAVTLNGAEVSRINVDEWTVPGKRLDGSDHKFKDVAIARLPRNGYLGFQDLRGDCWFKEITLRTPGGGELPTNSAADTIAATDQAEVPTRTGATTRTAGVPTSSSPPPPAVAPAAPAPSVNGSALAQQGRWKEAVEAFRRAVEQDPQDFWRRNLLAKAHLVSGDLTDYRHVCADAMARFGKTADLKLGSNLGWMIAVVPDALPDYREILDIAQAHRSTDREPRELPGLRRPALPRAPRSRSRQHPRAGDRVEQEPGQGDAGIPSGLPGHGPSSSQADRLSRNRPDGCTRGVEARRGSRQEHGRGDALAQSRRDPGPAQGG